MRFGVGFHPLNQSDSIARNTTLTAKAKNVNSRAGTNRGEKVAKGVGAEDVPLGGGWSVGMVNDPKWASTRAPPGKSTMISIV